MAVKINLPILTKNYAADPEIRFLAKSILKPYGHATVMPTAWELRVIVSSYLKIDLKYCQYHRDILSIIIIFESF